MAMRPCVKCLNNNWDFEFIEGWVKATCNICGDEVEFESRKKKTKKNKINTRAEYKIKGKKRFLKINDKFVEVELCKVNSKGICSDFGKFLRVMPI